MGIWGNRRGDRDVQTGPSAGILIQTMEKLEQGWFWATDSEGCITYLSEYLATHLDAAPGALVGRRFATLLTADDRAEREDRTLSLLLSRRSRFDDLILCSAGAASPRWWCVAGAPQHDAAGNFTGYCGTGLNITEQRASVEEAARLALYDPLTKLPNRLNLADTLGGAVRAASLGHGELAVMLIDLDRFKQVNDTLGHQAGDTLLCQVADRLRQRTNADSIFRLGGDEFLLVRDDGDAERIAEQASEIIGALSQPYTVNGTRCVIGASIGICVAPRDGDSADELIRAADLALYAAKHDGRGCFRFYSSDLLDAAEDRRRMESDLRDALARGEFEVAYQPYVDAGDHHVKGAEALARWRHPVHGYVSPALFVPVAEEADLIGPLGEWVLRQACADAARWPGETRVSVNISPIQFADETLPSLVVSALANAGLAADRLELEVTEGVFIDDSLHAETMFAQLKSLGIRLALDDFGTGYSSLGYLRTAPFDKIKIDQSFVRCATLPGSRNKEIVAAIVSLADALGMETTVEGVESLDVLALMRELGATYVQGYVFSKAISSDELAERLADGAWQLDPAAPARQRSSRQSIYRSVGVLFGGDYHPGIMRNLSATGALIEAPIGAPMGAVVLVDMGQRQLAMARVQRVIGNRLGVEFEDPLADDGHGGLRTRRRVPQQLLRQAGLPSIVPKDRTTLTASDPDQLRDLLGLPSIARLRANGAAASRPPAGGTVRDMAGRYLAMLAGDHERREQDERYIATYLEPKLGRLPARTLSPHRIEAWLTGVGRDDVPVRVVERLRFIVSQLLAMAVHQPAAAAAAPASLFDRRDLEERVLNLAEGRRLGAAARVSANTQLKLVLCLLLLTGLRLRELLHLRWDDIDQADRTIGVGAAGPRRVPMAPAVAALLAGLPRAAGAEWVLANPQTGKPFRSLGESWAATLRRADLADVELEDLRHGIVDGGARAGDDEIIALMGLADAEVPPALAA